jgi:hypothetical protein
MMMKCQVGRLGVYIIFVLMTSLPSAWAIS